MKTDLQEKIVEHLTKLGIQAGVSAGCVAVNRTSMCNSVLAGGGIPEEATYPVVLAELSAIFDSSQCRLYWAGKTDEDLFLDNLVWS